MELFDILENRIEGLLRDFDALKQENMQLRDENQSLLREREGFKSRVDSILKKLEGI